MLHKAGYNHILRRAALRNRLLLLEEENAPKIMQGDKDACDRVARRCDRAALNERGASHP